MKFQLLLLHPFCLLTSAWACGLGRTTSAPIYTYLRAPSTFQETDLVGVWERTRIPGLATESVVITADRTFKQVYDLASTGYHYEGTGPWWIEYRPSGCVYVHFEGMRNFFGVAEDNRDGQGTPWPYWDLCQNMPVTMPDSMIMIVGSNPNSPRGLLLANLRADLDQGEDLLYLVVTPPP